MGTSAVPWTSAAAWPLCLCCLLLATPALGRGPSRADQLAERGERLYKVGDHERAIDAWREAYLLDPDPLFLYNIARAYQQMPGDAARGRAMSTYERFLKEGRATPATSRDLLDKAEARLAELRAAGAAGTLPPAPAAATPAPVAVHAPPAPTPVIAAPEAPPRPGRPAWVLPTGFSLMGAGLLLGGFGISALSVNGAVIDERMPGRVYDTTAVGAGLLAGGLGLAVGGALVVTIPSLRRN